MIYVVNTYVDANSLSSASTIVDTNELNIKIIIIIIIITN